MEKNTQDLAITFDDLLGTISAERREQVRYSQVVILPNNCENLQQIANQPFNDNAIMIDKLLKQKSINSELFEDVTHRPIIQLRSLNVFLPPLLILAADPNVREIFLNLVSNLIYDILRTALRPSDATVKVEIIKVKSRGNLTSIRLNGSSSDVKEILSEVRNFLSE